jgi:hypothetical protein
MDGRVANVVQAGSTHGGVHTHYHSRAQTGPAAMTGAMVANVSMENRTRTTAEPFMTGLRNFET